MSNQDQKIDKILEEITEIKITMAKNTSSLEDHMRRTELNEQRLEKFEEKLVPVITHVEKITFAWKVIATIGTLIAFVIGTLITLSK